MSQRVVDSLKKKFPEIKICNITPPVENINGKTETVVELMILEPAPEKLKSLGAFDPKSGTSQLTLNKTNVILYFVPSFSGPRFKTHTIMVNSLKYQKILTLLIFFRQKGLTTQNSLETIFGCPINEINEKKYEKMETNISNIQIAMVELAGRSSGALISKSA